MENEKNVYTFNTDNINNDQYSNYLVMIYKRAMQYCVEKILGKEPNELHLLKDGSFKAIDGYYYRGKYNEDVYYFNLNCLTQNLDALYEKRKKKEEEERINAENLRQQKIKQEAEMKKEKRKKQYLKLKKEFESK